MSEKEALLPTKRIFCNWCSKVRNCAAPPDHLGSEISYRALATFQNTGKTIKQGRLSQSNMYSVRILIKFYTYSNNSQTL